MIATNDALKNPLIEQGPLGDVLQGRLVTVKADDKSVLAGVVYEATHKIYFETKVANVADYIEVDGERTFTVCHIEEFPRFRGIHHYEFFVKENGPTA